VEHAECFPPEEFLEASPECRVALLRVEPIASSQGMAGIHTDPEPFRTGAAFPEDGQLFQRATNGIALSGSQFQTQGESSVTALEHRAECFGNTAEPFEALVCWAASRMEDEQGDS
jgi:hypothetical protein